MCAGMFKKIARRVIRPIAIRYRRFMQAEVIHEIAANRSHEAAAYARSLEAALLTIALHGETAQAEMSKISQRDAA
jgi:hypothetical protein